MEAQIGFGSKPQYTPPPAPPPAAAPATLASSSVAESAANKLNATGAALQDFGANGPEGVNPSSVNTAKTTLGGVQ